MGMFQSHNGAIAADLEQTCRTTLQSFNPTMVRLLQTNLSKRGRNYDVSIPQWCDCCSGGTFGGGSMGMFQSHNGAIAAGMCIRKQSWRLNCFNPTMVRLLLGRNFRRWLYGNVSIPQWCDCCGLRADMQDDLTEFQSHNGAIAAREELSAVALWECFNPTMVRLLRT
jgi:hypothetical protein